MSAGRRTRQRYKRYLDRGSHDQEVPASSWFRYRKQRRNAMVLTKMHAADFMTGYSTDSCKPSVRVTAADPPLVEDNNRVEQLLEIDPPCTLQLAQNPAVLNVTCSLANDIEVIENESCELRNPIEEESSTELVTDDEHDPASLEEEPEQDALWQRYSSLTDAIQSDTFQNRITKPVDKTIGEVVLMVLKYILVHAVSLTQATDLFVLINSIFAEPILPHSRYLIDKLFFPKSDITLYATCSKCGSNLGSFKATDRYLKCGSCNTAVDVKDSAFKDFFLTLDVASPIGKLIESNSDYYNDVLHNRFHTDGFVREIYDGKRYRAFVDGLGDADRYSYATVMFNTDGAPLFESSTYSIWPIFLMLNEIPFKVRTTELILAGLWFGKDKPKMTVFLEPFVQHMNDLSNNGVECTLHNSQKLIKVFTLVCCVDAVARAPVHGFTQFNGSYGCGQCLHPGEWVRNDPNNPRSGNIKYPLLNIVPKDRNVEDTVRHMAEAVRSNRTIFGIKCPSQLINLVGYDIIHGNVVDSLHCATGIAKQFATIWFGSKNKRGLLPRIAIQEIDLLMRSVKAPNQLVRLARPFCVREFWKAREWENWIMFYSMVFLRGVLPDDLLMHWALFVEAFYLLSKGELTLREVSRAEHLLREFVGKCEILYGKPAMTFNVHSLVHLAKTVADWGPLWSHNAYAFESGNGYLLKVIHAAKGVYQQISRRIQFKYSFMTLKEHVFTFAAFNVKGYCETLGMSLAKQTFRSMETRYFGSVSRPSEIWSHRLNLGEQSFCFNKIVKNGCLYRSGQQSNERSNNSYAILMNKYYVRILYFIIDSANQKEYTIVQIVRTTNAYRACTDMLQKIVAVEDEETAIPTNSIAKICVHMQNNDKEYLCAVPSLYYY